MPLWLTVGSIAVVTLILFVWWMVHSANKLGLPKKGDSKPISRMTRKQLKRLDRI